MDNLKLCLKRIQLPSPPYAARAIAIALFALKAQLCGIRFPQEANRDLGQQVYTIRMHNAHSRHM